MASYMTPVIHATDDVLAVTDYNTVANNTTALYQSPYILAAAATAQSLPGSATTQLTLGATPVTNYGFSLSSNNVIVPLTGVYHVDAAGAMAANGNTNPCGIQVYHNGTPVLNGTTIIPNTAIASGSTAAGLIVCTAGDTIGLYMYNGVAGPASTVAADCYLHVSFVGSQ